MTAAIATNSAENARSAEARLALGFTSPQAASNVFDAPFRVSM